MPANHPLTTFLPGNIHDVFSKSLIYETEAFTFNLISGQSNNRANLSSIDGDCKSCSPTTRKNIPHPRLSPTNSWRKSLYQTRPHVARNNVYPHSCRCNPSPRKYSRRSRGSLDPGNHHDFPHVNNLRVMRDVQ